MIVTNDVIGFCDADGLDYMLVKSFLLQDTVETCYYVDLLYIHDGKHSVTVLCSSFLFLVFYLKNVLCK